MILFGRFSILFSAIVAVAVSETETYRFEVIEKVEYDEDRNPSFVETVIDESKPVFNDDGFGVFTPEFKSIGGNIADVSTRGKEVWVTKTDDSIHRFKNGQWQRIPGNAVRIGASPDGWAWVVNRVDGIYRFNVDAQNWDHIPGNLIQISALSKDHALGANRVYGIYLWKNGTWSQVPGNAWWASVGQNDERWACNSVHGIYRWDHQVGNWQQQPGNAAIVDAHSPSRVVVVNRENNVYAWLPEQKTWKQLAGILAKTASIGDGVLITLGMDGFLSAIKH